MVNAFKLGDLPVIEEGNPAWVAVEAWVNYELDRLRTKREDPDADQRKLDIALGSILALRQILKLPQTIRQERTRDPVTSEGFGIPTPTGY